MILEDQGDPALLREGEAGLDRFRREPDAFVDRKFGAALTAQDPAVAATECLRHLDPALLLFDLRVAECFVWMSEIRRATHHRNAPARRFDLLAKPRPVGLIGHFKKSGIPFKPCNLKGVSKLNPFGHGHAAILAEGGHVGFGKGGKLWHLS